jgi:Flp pilus assembly protein TadD
VERQLGTILLDRGRTAEALAALEAAVRDDPYEVQARHVLAQVYGRTGRRALADQVSARAAQLFALEQRANVLENQKDRRFLEPAYHQELVRVYRLTGQSAKAAQEQSLVDLLRRDPRGAADSFRAFRASLARALDEPASPAP